MNDILYRAYQDNTMLYQDVSGVYGLKAFLDKLYEDTILMQFTGLYDDNANKIFIDDVLEINYNSGDYKGLREIITVREFMGNSCFMLRGCETGSSIYPTLTNDKKEVIGNIHEHTLGLFYL